MGSHSRTVQLVHPAQSQKLGSKQLRGSCYDPSNSPRARTDLAHPGIDPSEEQARQARTG
jgi:hypothetical protein